MLTARGMACAAQLVPQVTELVISELLWLNYSNPEKPVVPVHPLHGLPDPRRAGATGLAQEAWVLTQGILALLSQRTCL